MLQKLNSIHFTVHISDDICTTNSRQCQVECHAHLVDTEAVTVRHTGELLAITFY